MTPTKLKRSRVLLPGMRFEVAADVEASVVVPHRAAHGSFARNDRLDRLLYAGFIPSPQPDRFLPLQRSSRESANLTHCAARSLAI